MGGWGVGVGVGGTDDLTRLVKIEYGKNDIGKAVAMQGIDRKMLHRCWPGYCEDVGVTVSMKR